ncbi:hypothetical protein J6590_063987 [Homalodisca vitripennis]|nr:hypothetical protein J6590_063987 [Homalodisca vitripennis]
MRPSSETSVKVSPVLFWELFPKNGRRGGEVEVSPFIVGSPGLADVPRHSQNCGSAAACAGVTVLHSETAALPPLHIPPSSLPPPPPPVP